jgi:hypothetical protein
VSRVAAYVPDVMDRSKVAAAASVGDVDVTFVRTPGELVAVGAEVVLVDLARPGVLEVLGELVLARTIGFASHVDRELIEAAAAAGCGEVLPRSRFFSTLSQLLA